MILSDKTAPQVGFVSYLLALILQFSLFTHGQSFCKDIFIDQSWINKNKEIENLNLSGLLSDMVLIQKSAMVSAVRYGSIREMFKMVTTAKRQGMQNIFFDEISLAIALNENFMAQFLYQSSHSNYKKVPLGQDLLLVAIYFNNIKMFDFFAEQGLVLSSSQRKKVLDWSLEANRPDVHWAMTQLSR